MAETPPFTLMRATPSDLDELVKLEYASFPPFIRETFMGCSSEADLPRLAQHYKDGMLKSSSAVWIKIIDDSSGEAIAASQWNVYPGSVALEAETEAADLPPWLEGEARVKTVEMVTEMGRKRKEANPGGYVHLHICFTSPTHRRRGAGALMMKWGCDVADALGLPAWIEASAEGNLLYRTFGFYVYEELTIGELAGGVNMRREPLVTAVKGGKGDASGGGRVGT